MILITIWDDVFYIKDILFSEYSHRLEFTDLSGSKRERSILINSIKYILNDPKL